jgi:hypothetical protein
MVLQANRLLVDRGTQSDAVLTTLVPLFWEGKLEGVLFQSRLRPIWMHVVVSIRSSEDC